MAAIEELIKQIADTRLRDQLAAEVARLKSQKKFGLVFEEHLPELLRLPEMVARVGARVLKKDDARGATYRVTAEVNGKRIKVRPETGGDEEIIERTAVVVARAFGEPMYPALIPVDAIERAPGKPWHVLINADNYHALQLLLYGYEGKVDVIYIDPPYNSGARDWKYNNNYVDNSDAFRHSKWLSMMKKRLQLAKRLLRPIDGVMFVTIDEHEVHHLGTLLEELFPEHYKQMVTIVINPKGVTQGRFSRVEEYALCCFGPGAAVTGRGDDLLTPEVDDEGAEVLPRWKGLLRSGTNAERKDRKNMFYPVLVDRDRGAVVGTGEPLPFEEQPSIGKKINGHDAAWPIRRDGSLGNWGVGYKTLRFLISKGYVSLGEYDDERKTWGISYLSKKLQAQIAAGAIEVVRFDKERNAVQVRYAEAASRQIKAVWHRTSHDAGAYGSDLLRSLLGRGRVFSFPKSVYAVRDTLAAVARHRPQAVILDFFAGSGTTLHATAMLNAEDGGNRTCVLATNNEVAAEIATRLAESGHEPGDNDWEREGIAESVTWPRVKACLSGQRPDGAPVPGEYMDGRAMADGFAENAAYFKLDFLDPGEVTRGEKFEAIVPILWMLAGCRGACQTARGSGKWFMPKGNQFAVLLRDDAFREFVPALRERTNIDHVFLVTDSTEAFHEMAHALGDRYRCVQLYRSYLDTFRINLIEPGTISPTGVPTVQTAATARATTAGKAEV